MRVRVRVRDEISFYFLDLIYMNCQYKIFYTDIQLCITILVKVFDLITHYFKNLTNRSIWLDDNIKLFYTVNILKLISVILTDTYIRGYTLSIPTVCVCH